MSDAIPAAAARCFQDLPEDVVVDILARVPDAVSLFRCAVVCRRWRRLVADPAFLRRGRTWPQGGVSSLVGFFVLPQKLVKVADAEGVFSKLAPTDEGLLFVPAPPDSAAGLGLGRRRRLTSFVRDDAGALDHARPLAARDGLLLVRLPPRHFDEKSVLRLCVCNLLTGRWDLLPPLDGPDLIEDGVGGYAVLTAADHDGLHRPADGYSTFFQVLLAGVCSTDLQVYLVRFSSDSAASQTWSCTCIPELSAGPYGNHVAAVTRGSAHWLFIGTGPNGNSMQIFDVSINDTGHVGAIEIPYHALPNLIPPDWSNTWLCPSIDGRLSLFYLDDNQLRVWSRQVGADGTGEDWHLTQAIMVGTDLGLSGIKSLSTMCIGEKSSTMLAHHESNSDHPYVLHLRSRSSTMVAGWKQSFNYVPAVPYEMNWSEFFMSRLGVQL